MAHLLILLRSNYIADLREADRVPRMHSASPRREMSDSDGSFRHHYAATLQPAGGALCLPRARYWRYYAPRHLSPGWLSAHCAAAGSGSLPASPSRRSRTQCQLSARAVYRAASPVVYAETHTEAKVTSYFAQCFFAARRCGQATPRI